MGETGTRPVLLSLPRMPRECPPRPNVPSRYTPSRFGATSRASTSSMSAGECVPAACTVPFTAPARVRPRVICRLRPMNLQPFSLSALVAPAKQHPRDGAVSGESSRVAAEVRTRRAVTFRSGEVDPAHAFAQALRSAHQRRLARDGPARRELLLQISLRRIRRQVLEAYLDVAVHPPARHVEEWTLPGFHGQAGF
jgi:hypothetical protein